MTMMMMTIIIIMPSGVQVFIFIIHVDDTCGVGFSAAYLSVFLRNISKTTATRSPNMTQKCSSMSPVNPFILGSKGHKAQKTVPVWGFALL